MADAIVAHSCESRQDELSLQKQIGDLRDAIINMSTLSQDGFSQITSIAQLCLKSMETDGAMWKSEAFAHAFLAIMDIGCMAKGNISAEAEGVGFAYVDHGMIRRYQAYQAAKERGES